MHKVQFLVAPKCGYGNSCAKSNIYHSLQRTGAAGGAATGGLYLHSSAALPAAWSGHQRMAVALMTPLKPV